MMAKGISVNRANLSQTTWDTDILICGSCILSQAQAYSVRVIYYQVSVYFLKNDSLLIEQ